MTGHVLSLVYHWLADNGLWRAAVSWVVGITLGSLASWLPWRRHRQAQKEVVDLLRTDTPGGLQTLLAAVQDRQEHTDPAPTGEGHNYTP